jgi:hypothetical protein
VLLTSAHQFPTGVVLSPPRRRALLAWARDGGLVIEDDYDAEHRYDRMPVRALQPAAPDHVAHTGSTSETLAPGMRLGWLVPPADLQRSAAASPARGVRAGIRPAPAGRTDLNGTRLVPDDRPGRQMSYVGGQRWVARESEGQPEYVGVPGRIRAMTSPVSDDVPRGRRA